MKHRFPEFQHTNISNLRHVILNQPAPNYNSNSVYMAIPKGKKYYIWFTFQKTYNVCVFMDANTQNYYYEKVPFSSLCLGTVLYGTFVEYKTQFVIENIFYYEGKNIDKNPYMKKIEILTQFFSNPVRNFPQKTKLYMAKMWRGNPPPQMTAAAEFKYIYQLFEFIDKPATAAAPPPPPKKPVVDIPPSAAVSKKKSSMPSPTQTPSTAVTSSQKRFIVKADVINDIYNLYTKEKGGELKFHSIAFIPDYKTSVQMNNIFRKIKENGNLDLLEESDDETEFEDMRYDKYVDLEKTEQMYCVYHPKFKKWVPKPTNI